MNPKVSIIIPTFNRAQMLKIALESVFNQTYKNLEIIIIDNCSNDGTEELINNYPNQIKYIRELSPLPSIARNIGIKLSKGEYIAFLDSDDQWLPDKLSKQIEILDKYKNINLVCSNALMQEENVVKDKYLKCYDDIKQGSLLGDLLIDNFIITSTVIIRKSLLNYTGTFNEDKKFRVGEDYNLWLKIAAISDIYYIPEALSIYNNHDGGLHNNSTNKWYYKFKYISLIELNKFLRKIHCNNIALKFRIYTLILYYIIQISLNRCWGSL